MTIPSLPIPQPARPLWRIPAMWFVVGGPAVAVVASITSAVLAIHGADRIITVTTSAAEATAANEMSPAMQARNHAADPRR